MGIKDLVDNTRTSIDETIASSVDVGIFSATMHRLRQYRFWSSRSNVE